MGHRELGIAELDLTPESPIMLAWYKADKAAIIPRTDHVLSPSSSSHWEGHKRLCWRWCSLWGGLAPPGRIAEIFSILPQYV